MTYRVWRCASCREQVGSEDGRPDMVCCGESEWRRLADL